MPCPSDQPSANPLIATHWRNWAGLAGGTVELLHKPASLGELVRVVQDAEATGKRIRAVGSGWAFEEIAYSPEVMIRLDHLKAVLTYVTDPRAGALLSPTTPEGRRLIHVEGGITIAELNGELTMRELAMPTLGGANGQTVVGALSTSTHGADFDEPPLCDLVHAMHLVGPGGQEFWIERASRPITANIVLGRVLPCRDTVVIRDDEAFDAILVGLGRFGIIYSVILEVVPAFSLARERTMLPLPLVLQRLREGIHQGTFVDPLLGSLPAPASSLNTIATGVRPQALELVIDSRNPAIVLSMHKVASNLAVSIEVSTLKDLRGSAAWIASVLQHAQTLGGRPHWGQQNRPTAAEVSALYGAQFDRWRAVLGGFSGASTLFSNTFTVARGLEPQGTRALRIEGVASALSARVVPAVNTLLLGSPV